MAFSNNPFDYMNNISTAAQYESLMRQYQREQAMLGYNTSPKEAQEQQPEPPKANKKLLLLEV